MVSNIIRIFKEEFKTIFTDKATQLISISAVFLYALFYLIPFHNDILRNVPIGVIDNDNTALSREFIRGLNANEMIKITSRPADLEEAKKQFYKDKIKGFVVVPKDFERDIKRQKGATIASYTDSAYLIVYKQLATGISEVTQGFLAPPEDFFVSMPLYNPIGSYQNYMYPLILIMILQQTMLLGITITGGTRLENYKTPLHAPTSHEPNATQQTNFIKLNISENESVSQIVLARGLAYTALYFLYSMIFFLIFPIFGCYKMTYNLFPMLLLTILFLFSTAFLGQAMLAICRWRESSFFILIASSVPFIFLPGFVWPWESIPPVLNFLAKFIPFTSASRGLVKINQMGADFSMVAGDCLILLILCLLYFYLSVRVLKRSYST